MSDRTPREEEELAALLAELQSTLAELETELGDEHGRSNRPGRSTLPRPPRAGELLRFTTEYTIPTVIATLRATIEALELLRRFVELGAGIDRGTEESRNRSRLGPALSVASGRAASDVNDALSQLRTAIEEADLPEDEVSRSVLDDARDLSTEIEERVRLSRERVSRERDRERGRDRPTDTAPDGAVIIDVTDEEDDRSKPTEERETSEAGDTGEDDPQVDVEAELASIKKRMRKDEPSEPGVGDTAEGDTAEAETDDSGATVDDDDAESDGDAADSDGDNTDSDEDDADSGDETA